MAMSFTPRLTRPEAGNKYYITKAAGGYSSAIKGSPTDAHCDVLSNCVGYAYGRFNEIAGEGACKYLSPTNAENFIQYAGGLEVGQEPRLGACMVWQKGATLKGSDGAGHVAIVEQIISPTEIVTSESGWKSKKPFWTQNRKKGNGNWGQGSTYKFLGFIYNPAVSVPKDTTTTSTVVKGDGCTMKYTSAKPPMQCFMTQSRWHKNEGKTTVRGVLWHSTGANNPTLKRYVQPDDNALNRAKLLELIGVNKNGNDWNREGQWVNGEWKPLKAGVHAFIGKLANGGVSCVQVEEWDKRAWGCGPGSKGSCNNGWIQFEICEDNLKDPVYFERVYREAVELTAYLCKLYNLDPQGTVTYNGIKVPIILCHQDSYQLGLGSNHGDVLHWLPKYGKSMQTVRDDVSALLAGSNNNTGEDEDMDTARFKELFSDMRKGWQDNDCGSWSQEARDWATSTGLIAGGGKMPDGTPNYMWADMLTREQAAALFYRFAQMMGKV